MKFVLVNDRVARAANCAHCGKPMGAGYLHEIPSQRFYCDHECYIGRKATPMSSFAASGIESLLLGGLFVFGSWDNEPHRLPRS